MDYGTGLSWPCPGTTSGILNSPKSTDCPSCRWWRRRQIGGGGRPSQAAYTSKDGVLVNSPGFDGLAFPEAFNGIASALEGKGAGRRRVNYRLRAGACPGSATGAVPSP